MRETLYRNEDGSREVALCDCKQCGEVFTALADEIDSICNNCHRENVKQGDE